jgi:hypothetical protein
MWSPHKKEIRFSAGLPTILLFVFVCFFLQIGTAGHAYGKKGDSRFYLVSVGVGDADLITVRAINTIKRSH